MSRVDEDGSIEDLMERAHKRIAVPAIVLLQYRTDNQYSGRGVKRGVKHGG